MRIAEKYDITVVYDGGECAPSKCPAHGDGCGKIIELDCSNARS